MVSWDFIQQVGPFRWALRYGTLQFRKRVLKRDSELRLPTGAKIMLPRQSQNATEIYVTKADTDWGAETIFVQFADSERDFFDIWFTYWLLLSLLRASCPMRLRFRTRSKKSTCIARKCQLGKEYRSHRDGGFFARWLRRFLFGGQLCRQQLS